MIEGKKVQVKCYSGRKADERPCSFNTGKKELNVKEIIERWYEPGLSCFKLRAEDNCIYLLKHDEKSDDWALSLCPGKD